MQARPVGPLCGVSDGLGAGVVGGRRTEVGSFLVDAERARLESLIKIRLGQARVCPGLDSIENVARGHTA